jgi:hypothetical protein
MRAFFDWDSRYSVEWGMRAFDQHQFTVSLEICDGAIQCESLSTVGEYEHVT